MTIVEFFSETWKAAENISTGNVVVTSDAFDRGIAKAVSGNTNIVGICQRPIASGSTGPVLIAGEGIVNVGSNLVSKGDLLMASTEPGVAVTATGVEYYGQICGMALETGTGIIKVLAFHI